MTPIYHDNVSQFQHIAPGRAPRGGTEKTKNKANRRTSKTCASGGARFLVPKGRPWLDSVAHTGSKMGHKITPKSIKKRYHRQRQEQSCFKSEVGRTFAEFQRYHEGEKPSKPCKGCSESNLVCMRRGTLTNTGWAWFGDQKYQKMDPKSFKNSSKLTNIRSG